MFYSWEILDQNIVADRSYRIGVNDCFESYLAYYGDIYSLLIIEWINK